MSKSKSTKPETRNEETVPDAWQRFERAVDVALRTPAMHREPAKKKPTKKTTKTKKS
jgi:hypothetical protein